MAAGRVRSTSKGVLIAFFASISTPGSIACQEQERAPLSESDLCYRVRLSTNSQTNRIKSFVNGLGYSITSSLTFFVRIQSILDLYPLKYSTQALRVVIRPCVC